MVDIINWEDASTTAANNLAVAGVSDAEGWLPSTVNNFTRASWSVLAKFWDDYGGVVTVAGTADAITVTTTGTHTALSTGLRLIFKAGSDNTGAATLNLDAIGAKAIRKISGGTDVALVAGDVKAGRRCDVVYDATANGAAGAWVLMNPNPAIFVVNATPSSNDGAALGTTALSWSDLFLASGGVINWNAGDVTVTHSANTLDFAGASSGYKFADGPLLPAVNDGVPLGNASLMWADLFLATGGVVNWNNGNVTITHSAGALAITGDVSVSKANPNNKINKAASGQNNLLTGQTAGVDRWTFNLGDSTAESGSNVGSDFSINRHNDAGTFVDTPFFIGRSTGIVHLPNGQLLFPSTQNPSSNANVLDDYEEGTWTPAIAFGGGTTGITYGAQSGVYTKVGRLVQVSGRITLTNDGSSTGTATLTGLPFTPATAVPIVVGYHGSMVSIDAFIHGFSNAATFILYTGGATTATALTEANFSNTSDLIFSASFHVA